MDGSSHKAIVLENLLDVCVLVEALSESFASFDNTCDPARSDIESLAHQYATEISDLVSHSDSIDELMNKTAEVREWATARLGEIDGQDTDTKTNQSNNSVPRDAEKGR